MTRSNRYYKTTALALSLLALAILPGCMPYSTGPTEVGVRTVKFSFTGNKGVQEEIYAPGATYFFAPFINDWNTFDTRLQNLEMTATKMRGDRPDRDDLLFKTVDGNDISLDVIISYRIDPKMAPMILQKVADSDLRLKENIVRTIARSKPRDIFGELNTEDFYVSEKRDEKARRAVDVLNEILNPYGVIVERVGTGDYRFPPDYQKAIEEKKVADQQAERFKSETRATEEEYLKKVEEAKGDIAKIEAEADGEYERSVIEADAYYEQQQRFAQAIEAEGIADAQGILKMNEALAGAGGPAMVKLQIAEALADKRIIMIPIGGAGIDLRTTDINDMLKLYGLKSLAGSTAQPAPTPPKKPKAPRK
ncbi:MAG: prohibitin family protein [Nitrospiraceae bacterium]|nr:prohibitin family protein [Nitrospiraceae bacterium]